jgi:hypothetical protein
MSLPVKWHPQVGVKIRGVNKMGEQFQIFFAIPAERWCTNLLRIKERNIQKLEKKIQVFGWSNEKEP